MTPAQREAQRPAYRPKQPQRRPGVHYYDDAGQLWHIAPDGRPQQGRAAR